MTAQTSMRRAVGLLILTCIAGAFLGIGQAVAQEGILQAPHTFLEPLGPIAEEQRTHFIQVLLWTGVALLPVYLLTPIILLRYRRRGGATYKPKWEFSWGLEICIWGLPIVIVAALSVQLWDYTQRLDPYKALPGDPVCVQAVGLDWKWLFIYPDEGIATVGELAIPVDRPVSMALTTDTVMQSLRISALTGQIYAMPGMRTAMNFKASEEGDTRGENTQYNGPGFPEQRFTVRAIPVDQWNSWIAQVRSEGLPLSDENYARLGIRASQADTAEEMGITNGGPIYFNEVDPILFFRIMNRYHTGAALDLAQQPGSFSYDPASAQLPAEPMKMQGSGAEGCGNTGQHTHG